MRKPIIAGNWKMYKNETEALDFVRQVKPQVAEATNCTILICAPYPFLSPLSKEMSGSSLKLGAQNLFWEDEGAYTGEVSAPMLKSVGCTYVIIGHSERRQYFGETNQSVSKKLQAALKHQLFSIVCVGETLEQRESNATFTVIEKQVKEGLASLSDEQWQKVIVAYEPVWAIGTGKTATPEQAQEVHAFIRKLLPSAVAQNVRIFYGGSVKPDNIKELMAQPDIDGGLVGGASLKVDSFIKLVKY